MFSASQDRSMNDVVQHLLAEVERLPEATHAQTLEVRIGPFWTVVSTTVGAGLASTRAGEARPHEGMPVEAAGSLRKRRPLELAKLLTSTSPTEAAVGLAAANALLGFPEGRVTPEKAVDILRHRALGKRVAMIGRFPFAESLRSSCDELWVFERGRGLQPGDRAVDEMPELLPRADIVAITATTLLNDTLAEVLAQVGEGAWTMMLGPSTPMARSLLDRGFDALCGTVVEDADQVLRVASEGGVTKQITGVMRLCLWK
jgi:uncharacterized protein (DUF4213/DUF364 family)